MIKLPRKTGYTVESLLEMINSQEGDEIRDDHPVQRAAAQWKSWQTGNFIRRILEEKYIPDILIAKQCIDSSGYIVNWLIDGKQRITTLKRYMNNEFAILASVRNPIIEYMGTLYEKKIVRGIECLKISKNGKLTPVLDENGKEQKVVQTFDIRGKKFNQLPPELQRLIKKTMIYANILDDCTDEDIQNEMRDLNSGSQMNVAQIGVNALGVRFADEVRKRLESHPFVQSKCYFSANDFSSGKVMRAISEALMVANFKDNWIKKNEDMCKFLSENMEQRQIEYMEYMFDILNKFVPFGNKAKDALSFKGFFVTIANFSHFLEIEKNGLVYSTDCYADFLNEWETNLVTVPYNADEIDETLDEDEILTYEILSSNGAREKDTVKKRIKIMNEFLDKYLEINCQDKLVDPEYELPAPEDEENFNNEPQNCNITENNVIDNELFDNVNNTSNNIDNSNNSVTNEDFDNLWDKSDEEIEKLKAKMNQSDDVEENIIPIEISGGALDELQTELGDTLYWNDDKGLSEFNTRLVMRCVEDKLGEGTSDCIENFRKAFEKLDDDTQGEILDEVQVCANIVNDSLNTVLYSDESLSEEFNVIALTYLIYKLREIKKDEFIDKYFEDWLAVFNTKEIFNGIKNDEIFIKGKLMFKMFRKFVKNKEGEGENIDE